MSCRHCSAELTLELIDLGSSPPSNAYLTAEMLLAPEKTYPLRIMVCEKCWLVQTLDFTRAGDYKCSQHYGGPGGVVRAALGREGRWRSGC